MPDEVQVTNPVGPWGDTVLEIKAGRDAGFQPVPKATVDDPVRIVLSKIDGVYSVQLPIAFVGQLQILNAVGTVIAEFGPK